MSARAPVVTLVREHRVCVLPIHYVDCNRDRALGYSSPFQVYLSTFHTLLYAGFKLKLEGYSFLVPLFRSHRKTEKSSMQL